MDYDTYRTALDHCCQAAGASDDGWNKRFLDALDRSDLVLTVPGYVDPTGQGRDLCAPVPYGDEHSWVEGSVVRVKGDGR